MKSTGRFTPDLRRLMHESYDVCRSCGKQLVRDVPSYAGYDENGSPLYVGRCCQALILELATHVYWWWKVDKRPDRSTPLWRYMDFAKFVALLEHRAIYFARADRLGDKFEGATGIAERQPEWEAFYLNFFREAIRTTPGATGSALKVEDVESQATELLRQFEAIAEQDRLRSFVSCWHANPGESEALWRLYCPPPTAGVAIRTDVTAMKQSLGDDPAIEMGRVQYVDFQKSFAGIHDRIFWKRKSLSHEAEVRAVIQKSEPQNTLGLQVSADLPKLIEAVVPSPFAAPWFVDLLKAAMDRFDVDAPVVRSELLSEPFF